MRMKIIVSGRKLVLFFVMGVLAGSMLTFISCWLMLEGKSYFPNDRYKLTSNVKTHVFESSNEAEYNIVAALFSGHSNWAKSKRLYRTVTCPDVDGSITITNAMGNVTVAKKADVIMFSGGAADIEQWRELISSRRQEQIWLYATEESIYHSPPVQSKPYVVVDNLRYNLTYGYHIKADIAQPFGKIVPSEHPSKPTIDPKPSDLPPVAWMSSRDHMYWSRSRFVHELGNYLSIDKYGKMGGKALPRKGNNSTETLKKYKFYLAFENSCCSHYITEKFWIALSSYEAVPIVVGPSKADYEKVAPPESFIYADDFESFESLADYVNKVSSTPELYSKFHEWREKYEIKTASKADMFPFIIDSKACTLLEFLRDKAWRQDLPLSPGMDPYGKDWLKSCTPCGKHDWLRQYGLEGNTFLEDLGKKEI